MPGQPEFLVPDWPAPPGVRALVTTREMGDAKSESARAALGLLLPSAPVWLKQVHGTLAVDAAAVALVTVPEADASFTVETDVVCAVMAADCMPVLLASRDASAIGAAHAGWRGLCAGVIERTVEAMQVPGDRVIAYLGPAIGPQAYEVGEEVRDAFVAHDPASAGAFSPTRPGHWLLDLYAVARQRLDAIGIREVHGGSHCTFSEPALFYSFRRDKAMQRMAACIWRV